MNHTGSLPNSSARVSSLSTGLSVWICSTLILSLLSSGCSGTEASNQERGTKGVVAESDQSAGEFEEGDTADIIIDEDDITDDASLVGEYELVTGVSCTGAWIEISLNPDDSYHVEGNATWCGDEESGLRGGVNVGNFDFNAVLQDGRLSFSQTNEYYDNSVYTLTILETDTGIKVIEDNVDAAGYGMNVSFDGEYQRE